MKSFTAIAAFAATAAASAVIYDVCEGSSCGSVEIISHCDEEIYFSNVPSQGDAVGTKCMTAGSTYSQVFTAMPNQAGWSMKLSPDPSFPSDNTQQYEYTWQGSGNPVWYDMSYVNGKPYEGKWNFTSSDVELCDPNGQAYRDSTDDAYGMQTACPSEVTLTLHLCPENAGGALSSASASESAASSTAAPSSTSSYSAPSTIGASVYSTTTSAYSASSSTTTSAYSAPASTTSQTTFATSTSSRSYHSGGYGNKAQVDASGDVEVAAATTTSVAITTSLPGGSVVTETQVDVVTQVQTMVVTARDAAPSAHAHKLRHEHRHPHGGRA